MRFRFIAAEKAGISVQRACELMEVSPSGYYAALERPVSPKVRTDMRLLAHIRAAFAQSNETYGSPRMVHELREAGFTVGRRPIARLMREDGLQARIKRRFKCTTDSAHSHPVARNHLARAFTPEARNTCWAVDMSYIWTKEGWLYLAIVMDLYSRRIVGPLSVIAAQSPAGQRVCGPAHEDGSSAGSVKPCDRLAKAATRTDASFRPRGAILRL